MEKYLFSLENRTFIFSISLQQNFDGSKLLTESTVRNLKFSCVHNWNNYLLFQEPMDEGPTFFSEV